MRAPLSIIVPTLNAAQALPETLACLMEGLESGLIRELIVTDGGSGDETLKFAEGAGAKIVSGASGRGGQLARGATAAEGDWFLFLHADTHLSPGWSGAVEHHISTRTKAGFFTLRFRSKGPAARMVAFWANLRSRFGLPYGDQGLLISAELYRICGGYPSIPLMEDVVIARLLRGQLTNVPVIAATSAEKYEKAGWLRKSGRNFWTLIRFSIGVSPDKLARSYSGSSDSEN